MAGLFKSSYSHLNEDKVIAKYLERLSKPNDFIVDIGAGDGLKMSNTYHFYKQGYSGLVVEAEPGKFKRLEKNYLVFPNVATSNEKVWPDRIGDLLISANTPREFLLLDLDIDSYDYFVLEAILKSFRPVVIVTEVNESIPPPVKFKVLPDEGFTWRGGHFFGYSLACLEEIVEKFDYSLVELHYNNAILISNSFWKESSMNFSEIYKHGYWDKPLRKRKFRYNKELEYLYQLNPKEVVTELEKHFRDHKNRYHLNY